VIRFPAWKRGIYLHPAVGSPILLFSTTQSVRIPTICVRRHPEDGTPVLKRVGDVSQRKLIFVVCISIIFYLMHLLVRILTTLFSLPGVMLNKVRCSLMFLPCIA
jgi:hypothetical protein